MKGIEGALPPCQNCGEPLSAVSGQRIIWSITVTIDANGEIESVEDHSGWCGQCIENWNVRMGTTK